MDRFKKLRGVQPYQTPPSRGSSVKLGVPNKTVRARLKREVPRPMPPAAELSRIIDFAGNMHRDICTCTESYLCPLCSRAD